jgi:ferric-dicitrate binding protein FerR (iron transport regulator)
MTPETNGGHDPLAHLTDEELAWLTALAVGELDPELEQQAMALLQRDAAYGRYVDGIRTIGKAGSREALCDPEAPLAELLAELLAEIGPVRQKVPARRVRRNGKRSLRDSLSVGNGSLWLGKHSLLKNSSLGKHSLRGWVAYAVSSLAVASVMVVIAFNRVDLRRSVHTYTTTTGQYATVSLGDGSRARLGPVTTLVVMSDPANRQMDVRVIGEVLFRVVHRPHTSFQVYTENAVTRVLGTMFSVRQYPADVATRVVVADGRVSLSGVRRRSASVLTSRTLGAVDDSGHVVVTPNIAVEDYTAWARGQLVFRNTPIRDVIAELGRVYNVEFRISDSLLAERHVTATVPLAQQSLAGILAVLGGVLDAHPVRTGRVITFLPGQSALRRSVDVPSLPSLPSLQERQYGR